MVECGENEEGYCGFFKVWLAVEIEKEEVAEKGRGLVSGVRCR